MGRMTKAAVVTMVAGLAGMLAVPTAVGWRGGGDETIEIVPVILSGVDYPMIGRVQNILSVDVNDACWVGARVEAFAPGTDNRREVLVAGPHRGPMTPVVVGGEVVRGTDLRAPLSGFSSFQIGRFGDYSYFAPMMNGRGESRGTVLWGPAAGATPVVVARVGAQAVGLPEGVVYRSVTPGHVLGSSGLVSLLASVEGPGVTTADDAVVVQSRSGLVSLLREGVPQGSLGGRSVVLTSPIAPPTVFGGVHFAGGISVEGGGTPQQAIFSAEPVTLRVQEGWSAPGIPGATYARFSSSVSVGFRAELAYTASLAGRDVTQLNASSVWLNGYGLVARGAQAAPGLPESVRHLEFGSPVVYGRERGIMVVSSLIGEGVTQTNNTALFAGPAGGLSVVARTGDRAPGTPEGVVFGMFDVLRDRTAAYVNAKGDVVFLNMLRGPGVTSANDLAVFVREAGGSLRLVLREGGTVRVNGTDRVVAEILNAAPNQDGGPWMSNGDDGRRTILNRHGECFLVVRFTDGGSALLKAQAAARPCPADFNADRFIDCFDYLDYVEAFEAGDTSADQNEDEFVDFFDYALFVEAFEVGC
jgi:hypothetical protein